MKAVIKTAFLYICYYKKQTLSILLSVIFSMALMSGVGSLVYSGSRGQLENARKVSGDWHYFIPADDQLVKKIGNHMSGDGYQLDKTGLWKKKVLKNLISMLYGDENYLQMRGLRFWKEHIQQELKRLRLMNTHFQISCQEEKQGIRLYLMVPIIGSLEFYRKARSWKKQKCKCM